MSASLRVLGACALVGVVIGAAFASVARPAGPIVVNGSPTIRTLAVTGLAHRTSAPDQARISLGVSAQGATVEAARSQAAEVAARISAAARTAGARDADITTSNLNLSPVYGGDCGITPYPLAPAGAGSSGEGSTTAGGSMTLVQPKPPICQPGRSTNQIVGYSLSQTTTVILHDLSRLSGLIDAATAGGANRVDGIAFELADPTAAAAALLVDALAAARKQAEAEANAAGVRIVGVVSIGESGPIYGRGYQAAAGVSSADKAPTVVEPGSLDLSATIDVVYEIAQ